jgi:hypothetical protein
MEPLTTLLTALGVGASALTSAAIEDAYEKLKSAIRKKWEDKEIDHQAAELTLTKYERKPEVWQEPMKEVLVETQAHRDESILLQAETLLHLLRETKPDMRSVNINVKRIEAKGGQVNIAGESIFQGPHRPTKGD